MPLEKLSNSGKEAGLVFSIYYSVVEFHKRLLTSTIKNRGIVTLPHISRLKSLA